MRAETGVFAAHSSSVKERRYTRVGETALSPKRRSEWPRVAAKEGARGGTMGSPTVNIVKAVLAAAEAT